MVRLKALHHIHCRVKDIAADTAFVEAFGLVEAGRVGARIYWRGAGRDAYSFVAEPGEATALLGLGFLVESRDELDKAVREHGASPVRPLEGPGGGEAVTLADPEGVSIHLIHGVAERTPDALRPEIVINNSHARARVGRGHDFPPVGPSPLLRLGHIGLFVKDFPAVDQWYREVLGLIPSDLMHAGPPQNVVAGFYRLDRGQDWVDHHTIAFFGFGKSELHHISFEVQDPEHQFTAHRHMLRGGWEPIWGVGRHPLGSHVFDLWREGNGLRFETFTDTDVVNADRPTARYPIEQVQMDLWSDDSHEKYFA